MAWLFGRSAPQRYEAAKAEVTERIVRKQARGNENLQNGNCDPVGGQLERSRKAQKTLRRMERAFRVAN